MIHDIGPLQLALLALQSPQGTVRYDRLCRDSTRWPLFFDLCLHVARLAPSKQRDQLLLRLTRPEPKAGVAAAGMERAVALAREALAPDSLAGGAPEGVDRPLAEALLADALRENNPVPARLARCPRVTLPILLVRWGDDELAERGFVADLTVWALPWLGCAAPTFVPAPASFLLHLDGSFLCGQGRAARAIAAHVEAPSADGAPALVWDVQPREHFEAPSSTLGLVGESASAAFALAGMSLLRASLTAELRAELHLVDCSRTAVSAGIAADLSTLEPVRGVNDKLRALTLQSPTYGLPPLVFVAHKQVVLGKPATDPMKCGSIEALVEMAAAATGGRMNGPQRALHDALLRSRDGTVDETTLDAVAATSATSIRTYLLGRYARWALAESGRLHVRFVNLFLTDLTRQVQVGAGLQQCQYDSLQTLLDENRHGQAFVLTGDPGSGKSTLLQAHELDQARQAILALDAGATELEFCLWVSLADYPYDLCTVRAKERALRQAAGDASATAQAQALTTPLDWLRHIWRHLYPQMPDLDELGRRHRIRLLLDGLNEIQAPDVAHWRRVVSGLTESIRDADLQMAAPIFTIRARENTARLSHVDYVVHQIQIAGWTRAQMRTYCARRLGKPARELWRQLTRDAALLAVCQLPINLSGQCELYSCGLGRAAVGRAEIFSGLTWARLRREHGARRLDGPGLLSESDLQALNAERHWLNHLLELPTGGTLISGLDRQAEALRQQAAVHLELGRVALWLDQPEQRETWIRAVRDLGLADTMIGSSRWSFQHQLWSEFFQARGFTRSNELARVYELEPPALPPLDAVADALPGHEMLPGPGVCRLEEAFKLAVQLSDEPTRWVAAAAKVNPGLAARAAAACPDRIAAGVMDSVKQALLRRSRDPACDLRLRIEAATELGVLGDDIRYIQGIGPGDVFLWPKAAHWVRVAAGEYAIGGGNEANEPPPMRVRLTSFEIAFAPVTNAEFARFAVAGGYHDERWWVGETAGRWWRGELRDEGVFDFWRPRFAALRAGFEGALARYFPDEAPGYVEGELRVYASWSEERAERELNKRFGARKIRRPGLMANPIYGASQPLLPVAGICLIEAIAYCRWLSAQTGATIRLATEAEWEVAARGGSDRAYPWGYAPASDRWQLNADPAHLRRNSPIGVFPCADTPTGLVDMAGNVEQLTCSVYRDDLDSMALTTPVLDGEAPRAARGGNWSETVERCSATSRYSQHPAHRTFRLGMRLVRLAGADGGLGSQRDARSSDAGSCHLRGKGDT